MARELVESHLARYPCADCGETDRHILEFDHLAEKQAGVYSMMVEGASVKTLQAEIARCEVVCVNCHRRRTVERSGSWRLAPAELHTSVTWTKGELRNLIYIRDLLLGSSCVDCRVADIVMLEFDHVRGVKAAEVMRMARWGCSLERLKREIAKCEIRCANCHRRRTNANPSGFVRAA